MLDIFHLTLQIYSLPSLLCSVPRKGDLCGLLQWASSPVGFRLVSQMEDTTGSPGGGAERQDVIRMFFPQLFPCKSRLLTRHPFHTTLSLSLSLQVLVAFLFVPSGPRRTAPIIASLHVPQHPLLLLLTLGHTSKKSPFINFSA